MVSEDFNDEAEVRSTGQKVVLVTESRKTVQKPNQEHLDEFHLGLYYNKKFRQDLKGWAFSYLAQFQEGLKPWSDQVDTSPFGRLGDDKKPIMLKACQ